MRRLRSGMDTLRVFALVALLILFVILLLQNTAEIDVTFLLFDLQIPIIVLILATAAIGFAAGYLFGRTTRRRRRRAEDPAPEKSPR